ncbi:class I SAM-dependent methyltransferase [Lichenicoccus roseus]|uniref:Class I SAM-dependent methyltransferase n=1 Tax=Lichenicoccus roseus TaxID=2683649 RepID=A0A5R9J358_9PROT|nr:class I SAM-dependent methyltransferase [Lichenicoccus roseus]TLU71409.1 class I SAM-dependent methyltransferase [Lichenicoccus roseus]
MGNDAGHAFVAGHYAARAQDYVSSTTHSTGADLDQIEALLREVGHGADVLDLGCGGGHVSFRAAPHVARVVACDLTPSMLDAVASEARTRGLDNIEVRQGAAERLPFADAAFDLVLSRFSAHHWLGFEAGLCEARRVLRPQGHAVFIDTISPASGLLDTTLQSIELLRDASHVRNHTLADWVAALARAGLPVESVTPRRLPLEFAAWIARTATEALRVQAIRSLQATAPAEVRDYFRFSEDGSFEIDTACFVCRAG